MLLALKAHSPVNTTDLKLIWNFANKDIIFIIPIISTNIASI